MPAIIPAAIGAAASIGGALLGSRAAGKATDAQTQANANALAFAREQEATRQARWQQGMAAYMANRKLLAQHLGIELPDDGASFGGPGPTAPPSGPGMPGRGMPPPRMVSGDTDITGKPMMELGGSVRDLIPPEARFGAESPYWRA